MELWIRTQNKYGLYKVDELYIVERDFGNNDIQQYIMYKNFTLGRYKTEERALEILDEIYQMMKLDVTFSDKKNYENIDLMMKALYIQQSRLLYVMPEE